MIKKRNYLIILKIITKIKICNNKTNNNHNKYKHKHSFKFNNNNKDYLIKILIKKLINNSYQDFNNNNRFNNNQ